MSHLADPGDSSSKDISDDFREKKKRRVHQACDMCRVKRVRCERDEAFQQSCNSCRLNKYDCTYAQSSSKPPDSDKAYIDTLEARLANMEALVEKLSSQTDISIGPAGNLTLFEPSAFVQEPQAGAGEHMPTEAGSSNPPVDSDDLDSSDDEYAARQTLADAFRHVALDPGKAEFFGKSSSIMFLQKAVETCQEYQSKTSNSMIKSSNRPGPRAEFWNRHPWLKTVPQKHCFSFPPEDLLPSLVGSYFHVYNVYSPLLHRPTFDKDVREGVHLRDDGFASIVLLVCALGSRDSKDPRVLLDGFDDRHSAGWKWFRQAELAFQSISYEPSRLYDLQTVCLLVSFLNGSSSPETSASLVGIGLRLAQTLGAHRRKTYGPAPTFESELLKRAFWILVLIDRAMSSSLGTPCGIQDEDFDVDLPIECDDEYWTNADDRSLAFKQPAGKPSQTSYFNCCIRLSQIHALALRTIYSISKSKARLERGRPDWEERTVAELDSALNRFVDSVPDHLRWNPRQEDMLFLNQSALLYAQYYSMQITVHRPYIPSRGKSPRFSFPSLTICANAARSCIHVLHVLYERVQTELQKDKSHCMVVDVSALFTSGMILLLNIWESEHSRFAINQAKEIAEVHKAVHMLKESERRCFSAGRLWDVLSEMATVGELQFLSQTSAMERAGVKESNEALTLSSQTTLQGYGSTNPSLDSSVFSSFILPLSGQELGLLPLHPTEANPTGPSTSDYTSIWEDPTALSFQPGVPSYDTSSSSAPAPSSGQYSATAYPTPASTTDTTSADGDSQRM